MRWQRQRKAFSMFMAIFVIVLMATVGAYVANLSGKMVKETTAQYQREQSILLAKSYTEYAIMAVMANDHTSANCLNTITGTFGVYNITVQISYIGNGTNLVGNCARELDNGVATSGSPLNIIVDVFVSYPEEDHPGPVIPNIIYHKRSLQKI